MSRSGYRDDSDGSAEEQWAMIRWRGAMASAFRGKRGQAFFKELLAALDDISPKRLVKNTLETKGEVCALGAVGKARGVNMAAHAIPEEYEDDPDESGEQMAALFGIADVMAREIMWVNDEMGRSRETPEQRFHRVYRWVQGQINSSQGRDREEGR